MSADRPIGARTKTISKTWPDQREPLRTVSVCMRPSMVRRISELAMAGNRSFSGQAAKLIYTALEARDQAKSG